MAQNILGTRNSSAVRTAAHMAVGGSLLVAGAGVGTLATALFAGPAAAASFTVTTLADSGAGSLRQAITSANAAGGADTISFAPGVTGIITLASDLPTITESVDIVGPGIDSLTISGGGAHHAFGLDEAGAVSISGLTVDASTGTRGGAINAVNTSLALDHVSLTNNSAVDDPGAYGGGVSVRNGDTGTVTITDSSILDNTTGSQINNLSQGGGLSVQAHSITVTRSNIEDNHSSVGGGALLVSLTGTVDVIDTLVSGNTATGLIGGIAAGGGDVDITGTVIENNHAVSNTGGVYAAGIDSLTISNTSINDNTAGDVGGGFIGILSRSGQEPTGIASLDRVTVTGNEGLHFGGLLASGASTITSSTIADNTGTGIDIVPGRYFSPIAPGSIRGLGLGVMAGSIAPSTDPASLNGSSTITNSTISGNTGDGVAAAYEGIAAGSLSLDAQNSSPAFAVHPDVHITVTLLHTLAADNGLQDVSPEATSFFSLIEKANPAVHLGFGTITGVDPGLLPLEVVSDTVSVVPISFGSPAWNAGDPDFTPPPATDQRGLPRVVDIVDIGAYEVQEALVVPAFTG